ncbi:FAD-dependent oxidoreductase [Ruficoccus amylovorans]|uniref:FAD-dependent oxidoreductase n=1 Tax=Ruficoccus amylovorans TaxID=1804625 RepID=A0A842HBY8_9BACT|nr:FAD-dependent oxidoreductase [Ruficoccus amylovorans]MBC2592931.1 FAD-dependent oxidoreductase [Ruficoccus amylovorans]
MPRYLILKLFLFSLLCTQAVRADSLSADYDLVVYGGTAAGVMAAVQAARSGDSVILLEPGEFLGGMTTGGLGATDTGRGSTVGGLAMEFYRRVYDHYLNEGNWTHETREDYLPRHHLNVNDSLKAHWFFEPKVASDVMAEMIEENAFPVVYHARLDRENGVTKDGNRITGIRTEDGKSYRAKYFIDATYEGDLMAEAGVSYIVGRESNDDFKETLNGVQTLPAYRAAHVSPYKVAGDPSSGLLPRILPERPGPEGSADGRTQAYNFRLCLTDVPENRIAIEKPEGYDPMEYEVVLRHIQGSPDIMPGNGKKSGLFTLTPMPNRKTDSNNKNLFSTDYVGMSWDWAEASYGEREQIWNQHKTYTQGLLWFLGNDPRVPAHIREEVLRWGLPRDEFVDNGHWPHQLYVREARRMRGAAVVTEHNATGEDVAADSIALASYPLDSHLVSLYVGPDGTLMLEGAFFLPVTPFPVGYETITPRREECENLLVPVCLSSTHSAFGSIRMEPVFMMLGQAAAAAIGIAEQNGAAVQDVPYADLRAQLLDLGMVLDPASKPAASPKAASQAESGSTAVAVDKLAKAGYISNANYWTALARPGKQMSGTNVGVLTLKVVSKNIEPVENVTQAFEVLEREGLITSSDYWAKRAIPGGSCDGGHVAALLERLSSLLPGQS